MLHPLGDLLHGELELGAADEAGRVEDVAGRVVVPEWRILSRISNPCKILFYLKPGGMPYPEDSSLTELPNEMMLSSSAAAAATTALLSWSKLRDCGEALVGCW